MDRLRCTSPAIVGSHGSRQAHQLRGISDGRCSLAARDQTVLGYVGDVLFPSLVLGQIAAAIDEDLLAHDAADGVRVVERARDMLKTAFLGLPQSERRSFTAVHGSRVGEGMGCTFLLHVTAWSSAGGWQERTLGSPDRSGAILILGSGESEIALWKGRWDSSAVGGTSRAVFGAFCDALAEGRDEQTGGAPQLVGMYRTGPARPFGVVQGGRAFLFGLPIDAADLPGELALEWRNSVFERCDAEGHLLEGAQRQPAPRGLGLG